MKKVILHPTYGEIVCEADFWSGKRTITINGTAMQKINKNTYTFMVGEESVQAVLRGNILAGVFLDIRGEKIWIVSKPGWSDWVLSFLPFVVITVWRNILPLFNNNPVAGSVICGGLGGAAMVTTMFSIREKRGARKILTALFATLITFAVGSVVGYAIVFALMA